MRLSYVDTDNADKGQSILHTSDMTNPYRPPPPSPMPPDGVVAIATKRQVIFHASPEKGTGSQIKKVA